MMEDDCVCEYDSTWDTESDGDDPAGESQTRRSSQDKNKSAWTIWHHTPRNMRAAKDMQNYRRGYPNLTDEECSEDKMNNLQFYLNKFPSSPDDIYIESFHKDWRNDYKRLERVHSYIQWLFPLREPGVNYMASELTKKEIKAFQKNEVAKSRLVESYELMLGFYGIRLVNKETGEVRRAENWKERFGNLERNMHNNLRITRILKSLGELGFEHYQAPLVHFFLEETLVKKTLSTVKRSVLDYFLFAVRSKQKRQELLRFAYLHFEPKDKFVWCPRKIQKRFRKAERRPDAVGNGDAKENGAPRAKSKDGDPAGQQKEESADPLSLKGGDKTQDGSKESDTSLEFRTEDEPVRNGNASEFDSEGVRNGTTHCSEDSQEMEQSPSGEVMMAEAELGANTQKCTNQGTDVMQTDEDAETEEPPKKKKEEDNVAPDNGLTEDTAGANGHTTSSPQAPLKSSKHSPSLFSEREGKIPRTDFSRAEEETSARAASKMNGTKGGNNSDQTNGHETEDVEMDSQPSSSNPKVDSS